MNEPTPSAELHPALVHHIVNTLGWPALRPLQEAATGPLLAGEHALLVAPTAGGKTEAAFFPLLSRMLSDGWPGPSVLYLCPLRALLNNLHVRLDGYARLLGRSVGLWHGDVSSSGRDRLLRERPDVLLTTPESLEAMLVSTRVDHGQFFGSLRAVVIDEAHAFAADDRGWHLLAVLERVGRLTGRELQRVALSATIGNPRDVLAWMTTTGPGPRRIIQPEHDALPAADVTVDYVGSVANAALVISRLHRGDKRLVFVDSRARAERLAASLRDLGVETFVSHGSLGREERRRAESAFAEGRDAVIVATSTLELGIDVGDLDRVIQLDAPATVASFLQRLGRTGRRPGSARNLLFLTTSDRSLLQAAALLLRWHEGDVEPVVPPPLPLHLVAQQCVALALQEAGIGRRTWPAWLGTPFVLGSEAAAFVDEITDHLVGAGYLHDDGGILGIGTAAEASLGRRHFLELLSVFTSAPVFSVRHGREEIGLVPDVALQVRPADGPRLLLLGGRGWKVTHIDWSRRLAHVEPAEGAATARWLGSGALASARQSDAVRRVLTGEGGEGVTWSRRATDRLASARSTFWWVRRDATSVVRRGDGVVQWWTFAGHLANAMLADRLASLRRAVSSHDDLAIELDAGTRAAVLSSALQSGGPWSVTVDADAVDGLKFSALLPAHLARLVVERRADARADAMRVAGEPMIDVSDG